MTDKNKKKIILGLLILLFIVMLGVFLALLFNPNSRKNYPDEPVVQNTLGVGQDTSIELRGVEDHPTGEYEIWEILPETQKDEIEAMISKLGLNLRLSQEKEGEYYYWSNSDGSYFQYSLLKNTLTFSLQDGISWNEVELTADSFSTFMSTYLDKIWEYEFKTKQVYPDGTVFYYVNRLLPNNLPIETTEFYSETDNLALKDGEIVSGMLLLTEFQDTEKYVPLLELRELSSIVNLPEYPKSIYFNPGRIASILSIEDEYLNEKVFELQEEVDNCNAIKSNVVYLYNTFEQETLTPVFKLELECTVEYEGTEYFVPGTAYVNAIEPEYISTSD